MTDPNQVEDPASAAARSELRALLDEELGRLPEKYRAPVVLCYLEGMTNEEAAARLDWPVGSVKGRLSRARDMLANRLTRRGLTLAAPLLAAALAEPVAQAAVPLPLLDVTVKAAAAFAVGQSLPQAGASVGAIPLVRGALRIMTAQKLTVWFAVLLLTGAAVYFASGWFVEADEPPYRFVAPVETPEIKADREAVVKGNTAFALDLYKQLANEQRGENLFLSPYSVSTALAMTTVGARGATATEMEKTLHFPLPQERLNPAFAGLIARLQANKKDQGYELSVANALWGQKSYPWLPAFIQETYTHYAAGLRELDFVQNEAARKTINGWVERKTQSKIKELIPEGSLDRDTKLVLTNAIYFKGGWPDEFDKKATKVEPFLGTAQADLKAPLMHRTDKYGYLEGDGFQALELPYKGKNLAMVVILPKKADGLPDLEKTLNADQLTEWLGKLEEEEVVVSLPKFKMTTSFNLRDTLMKLGMSSAFDPRKADFSGMDGERNLYLDKVFHKAFVDVNEEGTEAAAATAGLVVATAAPAAPRPPPVFRADHPFLFLIRDRQTGSVLFLGRLTNPAQ